jgi:hypothetical protein
MREALQFTYAEFLSHISSARKLSLNETPVVTGQVLFHIADAVENQFNQRKRFPGYAAYEIHPVLKLAVQP